MANDFWRGDYDAVTYRDGKDEGYWFFKDDKCVKTDIAGTKIMSGPHKITVPEAWPVLRDTIFESGVEAVTYRSGNDAGFWFFKGDQCAKTNTAGDEFIHPPASVGDSDRWQILRDA